MILKLRFNPFLEDGSLTRFESRANNLSLRSDRPDYSKINTKNVTLVLSNHHFTLKLLILPLNLLILLVLLKLLPY